MKTKIMAAVLVLSLGFNLAVIATFGHHWLESREFGKPHKPGAWHVKKMQKRLNLTDEQSRFMETNMEDLQKTIDPVRAELEGKRKELFTLLDGDTVDPVKVDKIIGDISLLQMKIEKTVVENSIVVRQHLTPEQRAKFKEFLKKGMRKGPRGPGCMREGKPF